MSEDYEVGHGKPPKDTKFKKGQSGNPMGRPRKQRKKSKSLGEIFSRILDQPMDIKEDGKTASFSKRVVLAMSTVHAALKGDARARQLAIKYDESYQDPDKFEIDERDEAMLERHVKKLMEEKEAKDDSEDESDSTPVPK